MLKIQEYLTDIISNEIPNWTSKVFLSTRKDGCVSVYITDIDALYKVIIPYFNNNLKARKIVDFKIWVISVNIYINGYHFIKEGREIINIISNCINEKRYSTNNTSEELNIINNNIIKINELYNSIINSIKPIFSVFKGINYTYSVIAIKYSKIYPNKNIQIYIYDTVLKQLLEGSPFNTSTNALKSLGLNPKNRAILRYLDYSKIFKNRYIILSEYKK